MAFTITPYTANVDTTETIFRSGTRDTAIGHLSRYTDVPHPGTGQKIDGWIFDKKTWLDLKEAQAQDFAPSIFDPAQVFIDEDQYQCGIGDNFDLVIDKILVEQAENVRYWVPRINHGYFYAHDEEWYLFSDDFQHEHFYNNQTVSGVLQYQDLHYGPKLGVPLHVRRYRWSGDKGRYEIFKDLKKKLLFTGVLEDGVRLDTETDEGIYIVDNIDTTKEEFKIDFSQEPPRLLLNQNYADEIGVSGELDSLEFLGISDGATNLYHVPYSPIDPSGVIELITWDIEENTLPWTRIPEYQDFGDGPSLEFKLDDILGILRFGDYNPVTHSGSGFIPKTFDRVGLHYTRGLAVEYEPEDTVDTIEPRSADANPLHVPTHQGFIKLSTELIDPRAISLVAIDEDGNGILAKTAQVGDEPVELVATVVDVDGNPIEGAPVTFLMEEGGIGGTFNNLERSITTLTKVDGKAHAFFVPASNAEVIGRPVTVMSTLGGQTRLTVPELFSPGIRENLFLYKVLKTDPVMGIPEENLDQFYQDFLDDEAIEEDPDGSTATTQFEADHRDANDLLIPLTFDAADLTTGSKVLVITTDDTAIHPAYGTAMPDVIVPLLPDLMEQIGSHDDPVLRVTYSGLVLDRPDDEFKGYFVITTAATGVFAEVNSERTGKILASNTVDFSIEIPPEANGLFVCDAINEIADDLLKRVKNIDEVTSEEVLATQDDLYQEYLDDRQGFAYDAFIPFESDEHTIALWHFDGNLNDAGPNNIEMVANGTHAFVSAKADRGIQLTSNNNGYMLPLYELQAPSDPRETHQINLIANRRYRDGGDIDGYYDRDSNFGPGTVDRTTERSHSGTGSVIWSGFAGGEEFFPIVVNPTIVDHQYTVSFWTSWDEEETDGILVKIYNRINISEDYLIASETFYPDGINKWVKHTFTVTLSFIDGIADGTALAVFMYPQDSPNNPVYLDDFQVELGDKDTYWKNPGYLPEELTSLDTFDETSLLTTSGDNKVWPLLDLTQGTVEFLFRTDGPGDGAGGTFFDVAQSGVQGLNRLHAFWRHYDTGEIPGYGPGAMEAAGALVSFQMTISGQNTDPIAGSDTFSGLNVSLQYNPNEDLETNPFDSQWHHWRFTWDYEPIDEHSGHMILDAFVDGISVRCNGFEGSGVVLTPSSGDEIFDDDFGYEVWGESTVSGEAIYYDEYRISDVIRDDLFEQTVTFSGEDYEAWFRRTRLADSVQLGLVDVLFTGDCPAYLPLGFRLQDSNYTLASMLDRVTFFNPNDYLESGYYNGIGD